MSVGEYRPKPGLLEVMIPRESLGQTLVLHNNERNAVGEAPLFVFAVLVKSKPAFEEIGG